MSRNNIVSDLNRRSSGWSQQTIVAFFTYTNLVVNSRFLHKSIQEYSWCNQILMKLQYDCWKYRLNIKWDESHLLERVTSPRETIKSRVARTTRRTQTNSITRISWAANYAKKNAAVMRCWCGSCAATVRQGGGARTAASRSVCEKSSAAAMRWAGIQSSSLLFLRQMNSQRFREDKVLEKKDRKNNQQDKQWALMIRMDNTHLLHRENIRQLKHHHTLDVNNRTGQWWPGSHIPVKELDPEIKYWHWHNQSLGQLQQNMSQLTCWIGIAI